MRRRGDTWGRVGGLSVGRSIERAPYDANTLGSTGFMQASKCFAEIPLGAPGLFVTIAIDRT